MRAVVVYESMYGNTHLVADAIGAGLEGAYEVEVVTVDRADPEVLNSADLLVVGGPTHVHGMSRQSTRRSAVVDAHKPEAELSLDPDAEGAGLREWFASLPSLHARAAAFDTRVDLPQVITGRASKGIGKLLRQHGLKLVAEPESFLVDRQNHLEPGEEARARAWAGELRS